MLRGAETSSELTVATYNVHACVGADARRDVARVARVVGALGADVIGLQEVYGQQLEYMAEVAGLHAVAAPTRPGRVGQFGNGLLTRHRVLDVRHSDVSVKGREPRGLLEVLLDVGGMQLRCIVTHFGLRVRERLEQVRRLLSAVDHDEPTPLVVLGDFNEWRPRAGTLSLLHTAFGRARSVRSFPARAPIFALDRIWVCPHAALNGVHAVRSDDARQASDHLPVVARLAFDPADASF